MNNILFPDKNNRLLRAYHISSKAIVPSLFLYGLSKTIGNQTSEKIIYAGNVINLGFHSYISTSCIITDYIKPRVFSKGIRVSSFLMHNIAIYGYLKMCL